MAELVITNGLVLDGTGKPARKMDVAVEQGVITELGTGLVHKAAQVIDAGGQLVTPGFIDIHSHGDLLPFMTGEICHSRILQGVTTEVTGLCGLGVAPHRPETMQDWRQYLKPIVGDPGGCTWNWPQFGDYLGELSRRDLPNNHAPLVSHGAIRAQVLGLGDRYPSAQDLEQMEAILREALEAGAFGLSLGLAYVPGVFAPTEEVMALARVVAEYDRVMMVHIRNHGRLVVPSIQEVLDVAAQTGVRLQISHMKSYANRDYGAGADELLALVERARDEGIDVAFDQHPYTAGSTLLSQILPPWAKEGGGPRIVARLQDPGLVEEIRRTIAWPEGDWDNYVGMVGWDNILISSVTRPENLVYQGKSLAEIAEMMGTGAMEAAVRLLISEEAECCMVMRDIFSEMDNRELIKHPLCQIGSDGLPTGTPHPRLYHAFPKFLSHYVRDCALMDWAEGIKRITKDAAERVGLKDRGGIGAGMAADLVIFDPDRIQDYEDYVTPNRVPAGISYVLVNGKVAVKEGQVLDGQGGQVLKG
ncbi:MAG: D-aminoacylase [Clostridia bacterium]|nr:D-aminoacylase [Clostridia bacterium]